MVIGARMMEKPMQNITPTSIYDVSVQTIDGEIVSLERFKNNVLLIVNVASQCGFTPQYHELEMLYQKYHDKKFVVLGFPCNQFGHQEPGTSEEIKNFCKLHYDVSFPLFARLDVNGANTHPLYRYLKQQKKGLFGTGFIKWNFTKFLVSKSGNVVQRFAPTEIKKIEKELISLLK
jgi:glutathione peroxidase